MNDAPENGIGFVLIPFAPEFKNHWELAISPAIVDAGLVPSRGDDENLGSGMIMNDVTSRIYDATIVIADLTGKNANVMYELGLAHSARKKVIVIAQTSESIPFDLSHLRHLRYDPHDLSRLRSDLKNRIISTLESPASSSHIFFPQLEIFDAAIIQELNYLRQRSIDFTITTTPDAADIFFNDILVGSSPRVIRVNPNAQLNTISAFATDHFEFHSEISQEDLAAGFLEIKLEPRHYSGEDLLRRVPAWLRWRRRSPQNPVLVGAVLNFLRSFGDHKDALDEAEEMLRIAPNWYVAWNQAGWVFQKIDLERGIFCFKRVIALRPDHYIGYFNLACTEALNGEFEECLITLAQILDDPARVQSFGSVPAEYANISTEQDFCDLTADASYQSRFHDIASRLLAAWNHANSPVDLNP